MSASRQTMTFPTRLGQARPGRTHSKEWLKHSWGQNANISMSCLQFVYLKLDILEDSAYVCVIVHHYWQDFCNHWLKWGLLIFFFLLFGAAHTAYGGSPGQGLNQSYTCRPTPEPQQRRIQAASATSITVHSNTGSLTHRARLGIEPATSWFLVGFIPTVP